MKEAANRGSLYRHGASGIGDKMPENKCTNKRHQKAAS
jgi:hypothetical protein